MNSSLLHNSLIMSLGWTLIHALWLVAVFALLVRISWFWIAIDRARLRYRIALLAMAGTLGSAILVFAHYFGRYEKWKLLIAGGQFDQSDLNGLHSSTYVHRLAAGTESGIVPAESLFGQLEHYFPYLVTIWWVGTMLMSIYLLGNWWYVYRLGKLGIRYPNEQWNQLFSELCTKMGFRRNPRLYWSDRVREPVTLRHLKPIVLFPIGLINQLSMEQVEMILLHELSHVKRWDYLINWLQSVLEILFFFHPAVWWLSAQARIAREHCCDDEVLGFGQHRLLYAKTLTLIATYSCQSKSRLAMSLVGNNNDFTVRIRRLFGHYDEARNWQKTVFSCGLLVIILGAGLMYSPKITAHQLSLEPESLILAPVSIQEDTIPKQVVDDETKMTTSMDISEEFGAWQFKYGPADALEWMDPLVVINDKVVNRKSELSLTIARKDLLSVSYTGRTAEMTDKYGAIAEDGVVFIQKKDKARTRSRFQVDLLQTHGGVQWPEDWENMMVYVDGQKIGLWGDFMETLTDEVFSRADYYPKHDLPAAYADAPYSLMLIQSGEQVGNPNPISPAIPIVTTAKEALEQSIRLFPNPFQREVWIDFRLPAAQSVTASVYDTNGRLVEILANLEDAVGAQSLLWRADDRPSGTYLIVLQSDLFKVSKQILKE